MFRPKTEDKENSILRCLPEDVLVEIVKLLDVKSRMKMRSVNQFFMKSKKINDIIWLQLMQDQFGFPKEFAAISEDKRLLYARLKFMFWRKNCPNASCEYAPLTTELMTSIVDGIAKPYDLGWLLYTKSDLDASYIEYLANLSPERKFATLQKAILARNDIVVTQLMSYSDLTFSNRKLQQLVKCAAESGDVSLVKKIIAISKQHGYELDHLTNLDGRFNIHDAAVMSGSLELVQYLHETFTGKPSFNWGVGSLAVLEYCHENYGWSPSYEQTSANAMTGSVELYKRSLELCNESYGSEQNRFASICSSGNIKLINYYADTSMPPSIHYELVGKAGNAQTCIELIKRNSHDDLEKNMNAFMKMYISAIEHAQYHVIDVLEDYYTKVIYPAVQLETRKHSIEDADVFLEISKDPLNLSFYNNHPAIEHFLEKFSVLVRDHFSEQLLLRILRIIPEQYEFDPWLMNRIVIRFGSEKVLDYCLERWPQAFETNVFNAAFTQENPKFAFIKHLIEVKGFKPDAETIENLKNTYEDEAVKYFNPSPQHKPK